MRFTKTFLGMSLLLSLMACGEGTSMQSQTESGRAPAGATGTASASQVSSSPAVNNQTTASNSVPADSNSTGTQDQTQTAAGIQASQAQAVKVASDVVTASNLSAARKAQLGGPIEQVILAAQAKDQARIQSSSGQLIGVALGQAYGGGAIPGLGLVDPAGLRKAIEDLVAAAIDNDLDGIKKAVEDIVAAST